jgi:hypothetical protein
MDGTDYKATPVKLECYKWVKAFVTLFGGCEKSLAICKANRQKSQSGGFPACTPVPSAAQT